MAVEKFNPTVRGESIPYLQANRHVVQNIHDAECLAVWIYLLSLPADWNIIKEHVQKHFNIGQDKLKKIFAYLNRVNLIEYVKQRKTDGTMGTTEIIVLNGSKFNDGTTDLSTENTRGVKTTPLENHTCGSELLHIKQNTYEIKNKKSFCSSSTEKQKAQNEVKHDWAEKKAPIADVEKQSTSYNPVLKSADEPSPILKDFMKGSRNETTKHDTRTTIQSPLANGTHTSPQSVDVVVEGHEVVTSTVRGSNRLMETRSARSYLEEIRLASEQGEYGDEAV